MSKLYIEKLILKRTNGETFEYTFSRGINYFKGDNSCGKTEFFIFLDYMLGRSENLNGKDWFLELESGSLVLCNWNNRYCFSRYKDNNHYSVQVNSEEKCELTIDEYINYLSIIIAKEDNISLGKFKDYADFNNTIRSSTAFNFLESSGLGLGYKNNFLTKCQDYKYQKWVMLILDFLFNPNANKIVSIKNELKLLKKQLSEQQKYLEKLTLYKDSINTSLSSLGSKIQLKDNLSSLETVKKELQKIKNFHTSYDIPHYSEIYNLNDITERIKILKNKEQDIDDLKKSNENRVKFLKSLKEIASKSSNYHDLISPLEELISELNTNISFSDILVKEKPYEKLESLKHKMQTTTNEKQSQYIKIELENKIQEISLIEHFIQLYEGEYKNIDIESTQKKINELQDELEKLKLGTDESIVHDFSSTLCKLYFSGKEQSDLIKSDAMVPGFILDYIPKINSIIPSTIIPNEDNSDAKLKLEKYRGSQARAAILQLCGYCTLNLFIQKNQNINCLPILVTDYFTQPITEKNLGAIGTILNTFISMVGEENFQIIMFDVKEPRQLNIAEDRSQNLIINPKTGFIPWYSEKK